MCVCVCVCVCVRVCVCVCVSDTASGSLPDHWTPHAANEHVKIVPVQQSDPEYQKVEANFKATLSNLQVQITAVKISYHSALSFIHDSEMNVCTDNYFEISLPVFKKKN